MGAGCVAIQVASKDTVKVVRTLDAGQAFGELALLKTGGRRAASVVTSMPSEFLTIDGQQYQQLLAHLQREELKAKVEVLRRAPMFRWKPQCSYLFLNFTSSRKATATLKDNTCDTDSSVLLVTI